MPNAGHNRDLVFIDSSVLFAAVRSPTGGSFRILHEARAGRFTPCITQYVIGELETALGEKYSDDVDLFHELLSQTPFVVIVGPPASFVKMAMQFVPAEDAPILAAAVYGRCNFLVTLDRKHFLNQKVKNANLPVTILTPGDFLNDLYQE